MSILKKLTVKLINSVKVSSLIQYSHRNISYKSALSLEKIYPNSTLKIIDPKLPSGTTTFSGYIPLEDLEIRYSRSSGPGGQNVNKVNTKVDVRFHLQSAKWLSDQIKNKLIEKFHTKLTKDGYLIFKSDLTRSQQLNLADCLEKIRKAIRANLEVQVEPSPESQEKARRQLERAVRERLLFKRQRSQLKNDRRDSNIVVE